MVGETKSGACPSTCMPHCFSGTNKPQLAPPRYAAPPQPYPISIFHCAPAALWTGHAVFRLSEPPEALSCLSVSRQQLPLYMRLVL